MRGTTSGDSDPSMIKLSKQVRSPPSPQRNVGVVLTGIVWAISAMSLIRDLKMALGIQTAGDTPANYIPAAYDKLVGRQTQTSASSNRYLTHLDCARNGRNILLDIQFMTANSGDIQLWLSESEVESAIESYRVAYRELTGVDLGANIRVGRGGVELTSLSVPQAAA
jgi:hypothetical protein